MRRDTTQDVICLPNGPVRRRRGRSWLALGRCARRRREDRRTVLLRPLRALGVVAIGAALTANAPSSGLEGLGKRVADEELGDMRGKFVRPGNISYFGISMSMSWQNSDDVTTSAVLLFSIDFAGGANNIQAANPTIAIAWSRDCDGCADPAMDVIGFGPEAQDGYVAVSPSAQVLPVGGLDSMTGAVQSQQIAGSDNRVLNGMQIAILPAASAKQLGTSGLVEISQSTGETFGDGSSLEFVVGANEIGLAMANGDGNLSRQGVNGLLGQASQHVLLNSSMNDIHNTMSITIGLNDLDQSGRLQVDNAMAALKTQP